MLKAGIVLLTAMIASSLIAQETSNVSETAGLHLEATEFVISLEDLVVNQEGMSIHWQGNDYPISSLEREGNYWIAKTDYNTRYCLRGHNLCRRWGLCHVKSCEYYVPPCFGRR